MEEKLVSLEVALLLKELGFDWECDNGWSDRDEGQEPYPIHFGEISSLHEKIYFDNSEEQDCHLYARPTQSLAQKWFRKVYDLDIFFLPTDRCIPFDRYKFCIYFRRIIKNKSLIDYKTPEDALEAALLESANYLMTLDNGKVT